MQAGSRNPPPSGGGGCQNFDEVFSKCSRLMSDSCLCGIILTVVCCLSACHNDTAGFKIEDRIPHDEYAFTQGLLFHEGYLYESTGLYGHSSLRRLDPKTGEVLQQVNLPSTYFAEGVTLFQNQLIQLTWREGTAFVYHSKTFEPIKRFYYRMEGWGLTHNGDHLIMSNGSATLYFRDPQTFEIVRTIEVRERDKPLSYLNELEFIRGEIWANVYPTEDIVRIDPHSGQVKGRMHFASLVSEDERNNRENVLNGIAYNDELQRVYITGKRYSYIYEMTEKYSLLSDLNKQR